MTDTQANAQNAQPHFSIQRIYLKDASFEAPLAPGVFRGEWHPKVDIQLHMDTSPLGEDAYEVVVGVTATAKSEDKTVFLAEVKQAGIFTIKEFPADQVHPMLNVVCTGILYPYVREAISDLVVRGSFPQLNLEPINFEALYVQQQKSGQQGQGEGAEKA